MRGRITLITVALAAISRLAVAQELEPRAYSASPVGTTFLASGVTRSTGSVFTDPSLPIKDVHAKLTIVSAGVGHTFGLFTRTALVLAAVPYARGIATGEVEEMTREAKRVGFADMRVKFSVNLLGGRAVTPAEFVKTKRTTIVGVSLSAVLPTGQYDSRRLVNLGANRVAFKPETGISVPYGHWIFDAYAGVWIFGVNHEFFPGEIDRGQDPIGALQGHVSYTFRPQFWLAFDATWYSGGTTTIDGIQKADLQRNSRIGVSMSLPLGRRQSLKAAYSAGATTLAGGDFNTASLTWQITWIR